MLPAFFTRSQGLRKLYCGLFTPLLERWGITQLEMDVLLFLANNPPYDTARDIVEKRHLAKSHVSVGVEALVNRGLLERQKREGNRKTIHLRPTDTAAPLIAAGQAVQRQYGDLLLAGFTEEERSELFRMLEKVGENVETALAGSGGDGFPGESQGKRGM
jgi:MarR family transcriptional regulator for hemolysin